MFTQVLWKNRWKFVITKFGVDICANTNIMKLKSLLRNYWADLKKYFSATYDIG